MINENFKKTLKYYRKSRGLTQDDLGEILGVSGQTIYKYENGVNFPTANTLEKILDYFHIDPNTLFQYESEADNDIEEIRNLLENHKRFHSIMHWVTTAKQEDMVVESLKAQGLEIPSGIKNEDVINMHRYLLMRNIEKIIDRMEETAHETVNPFTGEEL